MKKSNKLLLGGFLTVMLMVTGIHIALFAKYKNGNYTIYRREEKKADDRVQTFPAVSFVIVRNVSGAAIRIGDRAEVDNLNEEVIQYIQKGDSLVITGRFLFGESEGIRLVKLTLPYNATLSVVNSYVYFENNEGYDGPVSILTDSVSRLSIPSKHLLKAKITTVPNNP
jgi:hypothetical protein